MNKNSWETKKLGEVSNILMGQSPSSDFYNTEEKGLPFYQGNADFGKLHPIVRTYCTHPIRIAEAKDILISVRAPIGAINIALERCCIGRGLASIRAIKNKTIYKYIYYCLLRYKEKITSLGVGSTFKAINKYILTDLNIQIPSIDIQEQIIKELDTLSDIISKKKEQLAELDKLAQATFYDMFGDPITNEKEWENKKLESLCSSIVRGPFGSTLKKDFFVQKSEFTYKVYEQKHAIKKDAFIGKYYIDEPLYNSLKRFTVLPKDIIMSCSGTIGEFFEIPVNAERGIINQALLKFTLLENKIIGAFFLFLMKQLIINIEKKGSGIQNIGSVKFIKDITLGLPPLSQQTQFAKKIEIIEQQKALISQSIDDVKLLFDYTMDKYFN